MIEFFLSVIVVLVTFLIAIYNGGQQINNRDKNITENTAPISEKMVTTREKIAPISEKTLSTNEKTHNYAAEIPTAPVPKSILRGPTKVKSAKKVSFADERSEVIYDVPTQKIIGTTIART